MVNKIIISALVVFVFVTICLISVLILVLTMPDKEKSNVKNQICLPNEFGSVKCGSTTDLLRDYLEQAVAKQYVKVKYEDKEKQQSFLEENRASLMNTVDVDIWEMKPAAKLTGKEQPPLRKSDINIDMVPLREWCSGKELEGTYGFLRHGITYRNGRFVIPADGTYFIYSNVDFFEGCDTSTGMPDIKDINKPIKHGIFKFNILQDEEEELVSNVQPHTVSANRYYNSYSSYISSMVMLKAGDEISVKVSNITYIRHTRDNFWGVNLI